ncbi:TonB-like protein [Novosphingobium sp. PhB165]|nr:TonB-like protein [Novosphingobium sp. PhB165]
MRKKMRIVVEIATAMAMNASPASAAEPQIFTPTSGWAIDYAAKSCVLARTFSRGTEIIGFRFEVVSPDTLGTLTLIGNPFGSISYGSNFQFRVGSDQPSPAQSGWLLIHVPSGGGKAIPGVLIRYAKLGDQDRLSNGASTQTSTLVTFQWDQQTLEAEVGRMDTVLEALTKCTDDLVRKWGYDPAVQHALSQKPRINGNPRDWIRYPETARNVSNQTKLKVRVDIDEAGEPIKCEPLDADEVPDLATSTCTQLLKNAHFHPALDKDGNPVRSYFVVSSVLPWPSH